MQNDLLITYFIKVHKKLGLSPGTSTEKRAKNLDKDVLRKKERSKTKEFKVYITLQVYTCMMYVIIDD